MGKNPGRMAYDPMYKPTDENIYEVVGRYLYEWKYFDPDDQEMMPRYMPEALGKYVVIKYDVDANHAVNMSNRMSHYGIIIYVIPSLHRDRKSVV